MRRRAPIERSALLIGCFRAGGWSHAQVLYGATIVDLTQATGWLPHTTRAAITGLRKRGYAVIRERIGAGDSVYRISDAPSYTGDRTVLQRDAIDGRGPKQKAPQAA